MTPQTKPIADATAEELRTFAQVALGLEIEGTENRNVVLSRMRDAGHNPDAEGYRIATFDRPDPVRKDQATDGREWREDPGHKDGGRWYHAINIAAAPVEGGDRAVPVRVNGRTMLIPRGKRVMVPEEYVEAIRNASETIWNMTEHGLSDPREVPSYPYAVG